MRSTHTPAGWCPVCGSTIGRRNVLIEYETADGTDAFAECPECLDVVHPATASTDSDGPTP